VEVIAYFAAVGCVALFLICRRQQEENQDMSNRLVDAERRAVQAEGELGSRDAQNVLVGQPYGMLPPYRNDLHAAHARVEVLEQENARLVRSRAEIRRLASHDPPSLGPRLLVEGRDGRVRSVLVPATAQELGTILSSLDGSGKESA
jgi:hypothetical protein